MTETCPSSFRTWESWINTVHEGDALTVLRQMPDEFVQCCVTSPPYWNLRTYGVKGELGLERSPGEYVSRIVEVFREVRRVLRSDGTLWLNLGDSFASGKGSCFNPGGGDSSYKDHRKKAGVIPLERLNVSEIRTAGLKPKDLCMIPARVALALQADGWWLRSDIIWNKPNPMPESVTDRPTKSHEYIFLLTKRKNYYYDQDAVRVRSKDPYDNRAAREKRYGEGDPRISRLNPISAKTYPKANLRSVWTFSTKGYPDAHFATFPPELPRRCILAGTSAKGACPECGAPWERIVETTIIPRKSAGRSEPDSYQIKSTDAGQNQFGKGRYHEARRIDKTLGWQPTCGCGKEPVPCVVLDPFCGSGTSLEVAIDLDRNFFGIDLNGDYLRDFAQPRIDEAQKRQAARLAQEVLNLKS